MQRGQNYYGIMLICVLVVTVATIFLLARAPTAINENMSQTQGLINSSALGKEIVSQSQPNLLVNEKTGNVAQNSSMPCCANPSQEGCGKGVQNCTYYKGSGLLCYTSLFDTVSGTCKH